MTDAIKQNEVPSQKDEAVQSPEEKQIEIDGPKGPEPTRYGDWEVEGRVSDF